MSEISLLFSYDCLNLRHQYDGTLRGFNLDFSQGYFPKWWWLFHPRDLISMHICTTEPQDLITLFPVQLQMVHHLKQVTNTMSQFLSKVESSLTETTREVSSPLLAQKEGGLWSLTRLLRALVQSGFENLQGLTLQSFSGQLAQHSALRLKNILLIPSWKLSFFNLWSLSFQSSLQMLGGCCEVSPHLQAEKVPLPWLLLTGHALQPPTIVLAPAGLTPVCRCLLDRKALSLQRCQWLVPSWLFTRSPESFPSRAASQPGGPQLVLMEGWVCSRYRTLHLLFLKLMRFSSAHYCSLLGSLWTAALSSKKPTLLIHALVN